MHAPSTPELSCNAQFDSVSVGNTVEDIQRTPSFDNSLLFDSCYFRGEEEYDDLSLVLPEVLSQSDSLFEELPNWHTLEYENEEDSNSDFSNCQSEFLMYSSVHY